MSISGIYYRNNLQYILKNLDKPGVIDEIKGMTTPHPKEYDQLLLKYGPKFKEIFRTDLKPFMNYLTGFDIIKFDEGIVKPKDGISTRQTILDKWGQKAVDLIAELM
jgi:hypothetical protein